MTEEKEKRRQLRCGASYGRRVCGRLLAILEGEIIGKLETKCPRCGHLNNFSGKGLLINEPNRYT